MRPSGEGGGRGGDGRGERVGVCVTILVVGALHTIF